MKTDKVILSRDTRLAPGGHIFPAMRTKSDGQIVYWALPTIASEQPPQRVGDTSVAAVFHEDMWRQCEFFAQNDLAHVAQMIAFLVQHENHARDGRGYRELYVRDDLPTPLAKLAISFGSLRNDFEELAVCYSLALTTEFGEPELVEGGFAFAIPGGGAFFGRASGDEVVTLCLELIHGETNPTPEAAKLLAALAREHCLLVVDWINMTIVRPELTDSVWDWPLAVES